MQPTNKLRWAKRGPIDGTSFLVLQQWWEGQIKKYSEGIFGSIQTRIEPGEWRDIEVVEE